MDVFKTINEWTSDEFLSRVPLTKAKDGKSYICPECNNGTGEDGDGIKPRPNSRGQVKWKCWKCGADFSNFDLAAAYHGLSNCDDAEKARRLAEIFGLADNCAGTEDFSSSKGYSSRWTAEQRAATSFDTKGVVEVEEKKSASTNEPKTKLYEYCRRHYPLDKFLAERGGKWRGLTAETLTAAGALYHTEYLFNEGDKRPAIILPYDDRHYFVRAIEGKGKTKSAGSWGEAGLYVAKPIYADNNLNVIVEGELDALSFAQVWHRPHEFGFVATGSADNWRKVVPWLEKQFGNAAQKPKMVVAFDNDEGGRTAAKKLADALEAAGYPVMCIFFHEKDKPKVDANDLLQQGEDKLIERFYAALEFNEPDLDKSKERIAERRTKTMELQVREAKAAEQVQANQSGYQDFWGATYFSEQFLSDATLLTKYADRRTGFDNLDGTGKFKFDGQKQVFAPGLYMLGAQPGAGKTTFAFQMLSQLAATGIQCIFCSYEMSRLELFSKAISRELFLRHRDGEKVAALSAIDCQRAAASGNPDVRAVVEQLAFSPSMKNLLVRETSNCNVLKLIESLKPLCADVEQPPIIAIDYLQIIPPTNGKATAKEKIDEIMLRLKDFQRATDSTIILISAFNRASNQEESPALTAFRESSAIEYTADVAWTLKTKGGREGLQKKPREIELHCLKNRKGSVYTCFFNYYAASDCFEPCREQELGDDDD